MVAFSRREHQKSSEAIRKAAQGLRGIVHEVYPPAPLPSERSVLRRAFAHVRSVASGKPYTVFEYRSATFSRGLAEAMASRRPDLVHLDSLDLAGFIGLLPDAPIACTHHSVESELLRLRAEHIRPRLLGSYLKFQAELIEDSEREFCPLMATNIMMSDTDARRLESLVPGSRTDVVPNGVDTTALSPPGEPRDTDRIVFLGPTYVYPNFDALSFFLKQVWPLVRSADRKLRFEIVGKVSTRHRERFEAENVTCLGHVDDLKATVGRALCSVVPIRIGGGTRLKILDSWALGTPVVSTSIGCEGLETRDGRNILIRDDPREFAAAILELRRNADLRDTLGDAGRQTAESAYAWSVVGDRIRGIYRRLIDA